MPSWLENILLGKMPARHRSLWVVLLIFLLILVPIIDYASGRSAFHFNLYPVPVALSIFLFGHQGLFSVLILLVSYHLVQVSLQLEAHAVLLNNLAQLALTYVVGLLCSWLVEAYRRLYQQKSELANTRHELLLSLAHELRSPLFAIGGIVRNLSRNASRLSEEAVQEQLSEAQAAIAAINRDVDGLTQVFRSDLGQLEPRFESVSVRCLFEKVVKRHPPDFYPSHQLKIVDNPRLEAQVYCDPLLTQQCLDNLISNALRHTDAGYVSLSSVEHADEIELRVEDQGAGIAEGDRERIFNRHEKGTRQAATGFGVGLYLVKIYARSQQARISVGDASGGGARFSLFLKKGTRD